MAAGRKVLSFLGQKQKVIVFIFVFVILMLGGAAERTIYAAVNDVKTEVPREEIIENAPQIMRGEWDLIDPETIYRFVFAPLPEIVEELAQKAPVLKEVLDKLGIDRLSALWKAKDIDVPIPGLQEKGEMTTDLLYAQDVATGLDLRVHIVFDEEHFLAPRIQTLPNRITRLLVKPSLPVEGISGLLTLKPKPLTPDTIDNPADVEKQILNQWTFSDPDHDGIYATEFTAPPNPENYNLSVVYNRIQNSDLPRLKMTLAVVSPGIVYEKVAGKEQGIAQAEVVLYTVDAQTGLATIWEASVYKQENPLKTNQNGAYSFFVPPGLYRLEVKAKRFQDYTGPKLQITEAQALQERIMLERKPFWKFILEAKLWIISLFSF